MKTQFFSTVLSVMLCCMVFLMACRHEKAQQFNVDLQYSDGSKESYAMYEGSTLLVNDGDMHVVAKVKSGNENELELEVTRYTITHDSIKREHTIQKAGANTNKISKAKNTALDPTGTVQVNLQSMAMIDTGRQPKGACKGICCEATCFSVWCCYDVEECKNAPCDCKSPSNCPGQPSGGQTAALFELFKSGKDMMVFKD
ncbi:MAG TPA: hypothetical protein VFG10_03650 [Saprospiraceae bacterium]|nr:hypothetical protein [Saprospiraceae bacterium]